MDLVAIVLASGEGKRFQNNTVPKHLIEILGIPVIIWTIKNIIDSKIFSKIIIVSSSRNLKITKAEIEKFFNESKDFFEFVDGSDSRMGSFLNGLKNYEDSMSSEDAIISLFDANRPFFNKNQILDLYENSVVHGCSCPGNAVTNGVAKIDNNKIIEVPSKENYIEFVTPEFMKYSLLKKSMNLSSNRRKCFVEYALALKINPIVSNSLFLNMKLTYPNDVTHLEKIAIENKFQKPKINT